MCFFTFLFFCFFVFLFFCFILGLELDEAAPQVCKRCLWIRHLMCTSLFFFFFVYVSCFNAGGPGPSIKKRKMKKPSDLFPLPEVTIFNLVHALQDCRTLDEGCIGSLVPSLPLVPLFLFVSRSTLLGLTYFLHAFLRGKKMYYLHLQRQRKFETH
jgi:hypothetical protein